MKLLSLIPLLALCACKSAVVDSSAKLEPASTISNVVLNDGTALTIQRSFTGDATGETLYKAWVCKHYLHDCQLAATIDTQDHPPPHWRAAFEGAEIVIADTDNIWGFCNSVQKRNGSDLRIRLITL